MRLKLVGWLNMNNKGQVLIVFLLIIPVLMLGAVYIIDNIYIAYNTNKLNEINSLVINDAVINDLSAEEIREYIKKNDKDIEVEFILISTDKIEIRLSKKIKSLFGIVVGKKDYTITSNKTMKIIDKPVYQ